jgi:transcriptional regulator with XRE-family HTH domain
MLGLSQQEMAERFGHEMTNKNISKYERARSVPPIELVLAYARVANVIMEQIRRRRSGSAALERMSYEQENT